MQTDQITKEELEEIHSTVKVTSYLETNQYLAKVYEVLKSKRKRYSYVLFSEHLGFGNTNVIFLIIKGRRPLSVKAAEKISNALQLKGPEKKYFTLLAKYHASKKSIEREKLFEKIVETKSKVVSNQLSRSQLDFFSDWHHVVIPDIK